MGIISDFIIFSVACFFIYKTADMFVKGAVEVSLALKLSKVFIAVTLVSVITTMPELIVSVSSSYLGETGMSIGNAIGSCICNIGLVFAIGAILSDIKLKKDEFLNRMAILLTALLVVYIFSLSGTIGRNEGAVLLVLTGVFFGYNYYLALKNKKEIEHEISAEGIKGNLANGTLLLVLGGFLTIILARFGLVSTGINIANFFHVPPILIGLTLVAVGTSLPELFTSIISSKSHHGEIIFGNVIGANMLNLLFVLGVAAIVRPQVIDRPTLMFNMPFALLMTMGMLVMGLFGMKFDRGKGLVLLALYAFYVCFIYVFIYGRL
jgi:cation:H+ antiporter